MKSRRSHHIIPKQALPFAYLLRNVFSRPFAIYVTFAVVLILLSLFNPSFFSVLRSHINDAFAPSVSAVARPFQAVGSFFADTTSLTETRAKVKQLQTENDRLNDWYQMAQLLRAENQSLRALLNVQIEDRATFLTTRVLLDSKSPYIKTLLIAAGKKDNVLPGQAVIGEGGIIGRVVDVYDETARVLLITDINSRIPVQIEGTSQKGIVAGNNTKLLELVHYSESITLEKGMRLITSGDGRLLPAGLPVGIVDNVSASHVSVRPFSQEGNLVFVRLLERPKGALPIDVLLNAN